jgi:hypothetical protein
MFVKDVEKNESRVAWLANIEDSLLYRSRDRRSYKNSSRDSITKESNARIADLLVSLAPNWGDEACFGTPNIEYSTGPW